MHEDTCTRDRLGRIGLLSLSLSLGPEPGCGPPCTLIGCGDPVNIQITRIPMVWQAFAPAPLGSIAVCQNETCVSGSWDADSRFSNQKVGQAAPSYPWVYSVLVREGEVSSVKINWQPGPSGRLQDGDVYSVVVTDGSGREVARLTRTVRYTASYPNGPSCGGACLQVSIVAPSD